MKWINVEDAEPKDHGNVRCYGMYKWDMDGLGAHQFDGFFNENSGEWHSTDGGKVMLVSHWMELPEDPQ